LSERIFIKAIIVIFATSVGVQPILAELKCGGIQESHYRRGIRVLLIAILGRRPHRCRSK